MAKALRYNVSSEQQTAENCSILCTWVFSAGENVYTLYVLIQKILAWSWLIQIQGHGSFWKRREAEREIGLEKDGKGASIIVIVYSLTVLKQLSLC